MSAKSRIARKKRHRRVRARISGSSERPRLNVFRSLNHRYAQVIDDTVGHTLVAASTLDKEIASKLTAEEEEIIASTESVEDEMNFTETATAIEEEVEPTQDESVMTVESHATSEGEITSVTENEPAIDEVSEVDEPVIAETTSDDEEPKLETAAVESDDYSEMEDVDSKFGS